MPKGQVWSITCFCKYSTTPQPGPFFMYCLQLLCTTRAELGSCYRHWMVHKVKNIYFLPFTIKHANFWPKLWIFSSEKMYICFCQDQRWGGSHDLHHPYPSLRTHAKRMRPATEKKGLQSTYSTTLLEAAISYLLFDYIVLILRQYGSFSFKGWILGSPGWLS